MVRERCNKKVFITLAFILFIFVFVLGGTYAWFTLQLKGTKVNVLKAGTLSIILNDENSMGISQEKAVPTLDEVGETLDPYHFTLENHGEMASDYTIYFDDIDLEADETRMSDSFVKYQLMKDGVKTTALLSKTGSHPNRILDSGTIAGGQTITYDLRLWIDSATGNEAMGQVVRGKIRVLALQSQTTDTKEVNPNIQNIYTYDANTCVTGEEATCVEIKNTPDTYQAGTIIKYKVNDTESKYFYVLSDNKEEGTLTMQQRENTVHATKWSDDGSDVATSRQGPITILPILERATEGWTNVKDQTYTVGVTTFKDNAFTGCVEDEETNIVSCGINTYQLPERTGKARMITVQEAGSLGCKYNSLQTCPAWMNNYLLSSTDFGGTEVESDAGYWTMSSHESYDTQAFTIFTNGSLYSSNTILLKFGARAVVVIDK